MVRTLRGAAALRLLIRPGRLALCLGGTRAPVWHHRVLQAGNYLLVPAVCPRRSRLYALFVTHMHCGGRAPQGCGWLPMYPPLSLEEPPDAGGVLVLVVLLESAVNYLMNRWVGGLLQCNGIVQ